MTLSLVVLSSVDGENRPEPCSIRAVVLEDGDVELHRFPLSESPGCGGGEGRHLALHVGVGAVPVLLRELRQTLPLSEGVEAPHATEGELDRLGVLLLLPLEGGEGVLPSFELDVPVLSQLEVVHLVGVNEDTDGDVGLLERVVDADELLDRLQRRVAEHLELLVVESFGVGATLECVAPEGGDGDGEDLVVVLHELGEVEERLDDLGGEGWRRERRRDRTDEFLLQWESATAPKMTQDGTYLVLVVQLGPAGDECSVEEISGEGVVHLCEIGAGT
jgi:hypothetical protein